MKSNLAAKTLILVLSIMLAFCVLLSGCKSREAAATDRLFEKLNVEAPDGEAVAKAREAYAGLSSEEKAELEYYEHVLRMMRWRQMHVLLLQMRKNCLLRKRGTMLFLCSRPQMR